MATNNSNNKNPFTEGFQKMSEAGCNMFNSNSMFPMMDMNQLMTIQRRNAETLSAASHVVAANMQALMRRQAEMMQSSAKELFQLMKEISVSPSTESTISKQKEFAQHGFKSAMSSASEMVEMVAKSQVELFDIIGKRVTENFEEVCNTAPAKKKSA